MAVRIISRSQLAANVLFDRFYRPIHTQLGKIVCLTRFERALNFVRLSKDKDGSLRSK